MVGPWVRTSASCPDCGKGGAVFVDPTFARLLGYLVTERSAEGPALSVKCVRCRSIYTIMLAEISVPERAHP